MSNFFERTIQLIGLENFEKIQKSKVVLFGVGGVGGTTLESLVRSGFKNIMIVDFDTVSETNINRQILFTANDIGKIKVEVAKEKMESINPEVVIENINEKVNSDFFNKYRFDDVDYFIDAIDDCDGKLAIAKYAFENKIKLIMCLGMGNRLDPSQLFITSLNKTENDPLARKIRQIFRRNNLDLQSISVVASKENPIKTVGNPSSMMMVPSAAGLLITYKVIKDIVQ